MRTRGVARRPARSLARPTRRVRAVWAGLLVLAAASLSPRGLPSELPTPAEVLGFDPARSGSVVDTRDVARYADAVADASERAAVVPFGLSTDGVPLRLVLVSSPENLARWPELRRSGDKVFALVTCGIHPDEVGSTAAFFPLLHRLASARDPQHQRLLDSIIVILVPCMNPDGTDRVASWLRREGRAAAGALPVLYHRYCGHDLNRDWLLATQAETRAVIRRVHHVFLPWVTIDIHQMGRFGPRLFLPPYAEPLDPAIARDIRAQVDALGNEVFESLAREGKQGVVRRWVYDGWTPARAYPFYHGGLRFLLEAASADYAHPLEVRESDLWVFGAGNHPGEDHPHPWKGGPWDLEQTTDLLVEATLSTLRALLDEPLRSGQRAYLRRVLREDDGVLLDGRGVDPGVARSLLRQLRVTGARITEGEESATWILRDPPWGAGWCRSLLLCTPYPSALADRGTDPRSGGFNAKPYDTATHDLALMAGLKAAPWQPGAGGAAPAGDRAAALAAHLDGKAEMEVPASVPGRLTELSGEDVAARWLVTGRSLETYRHLADLLDSGARIERLTKDVEERGAAAGDLLLDRVHRDWIERLVLEGADAVRIAPDHLRDVESSPLRYPRRLWVLQGSRPSMDEGWLRWVLESYRFRFRRLALDELLVDRDFGRRAAAAEWGRAVVIIPEGTLLRPERRLKPILDDLVRGGGRVIALGRASRWLARTCELPVEDVELEPSALPGTLLRTRPLASSGRSEPVLWGYRRTPDVFYHRGPLWRRTAPWGDDESAVVTEDVIGIDPERPLVCGLLDAPHAPLVSGATALARVRDPASGGEWLLCGFRPHFRGWTLGTFRLLFNMILAP